MTTYKIKYEYSQTEDTLLECAHEPTREELEHAVSWDTLRFHRQELAIWSWSIISVVPLE
ncbi:hypothetical protein FJP64_22240 [Kosakonia cowanii]|jgi:hypothetical protein|uniref:hypothetical protein n=1 Tax=Kosakonia cowanii TaxID=208223 RepID=UPI00112019ED|nr:hypothetical protein [Kosakonia cowanii]MDP9771122.1 hypothetical protein [Atlantibacter hermannii]TPD59688.1 hypothetical protein FJP70_22165 [Kosakonia cowanii]TPD83354.1 hypothetical protein FJP67_22160 [Kosakonia cowanii]TPE00695.1 hypothetical protein FJP64_22240 [Kosakonia cowanii]